MVVSKTCSNQISMLDIAKAASKEYGITLEEFRKIIKQPEHPYELRDQFAMAAISSMTMNSSNINDVVRIAYKFADAMLEARKVKNER